MNNLFLSLTPQKTCGNDQKPQKKSLSKKKG